VSSRHRLVPFSPSRLHLPLLAATSGIRDRCDGWPS
jgi:hypothetical protein